MTSQWLWLHEQDKQKPSQSKSNIDDRGYHEAIILCNNSVNLKRILMTEHIMVIDYDRG